MRVELERTWHEPAFNSCFGTITCAEVGFGAISLERDWQNNAAGRSCVPAGFYYLEPHNGTKYKGTFALIGADVSHIATPGIARSACVLHWADRGHRLEGCISAGSQIVADINRADLVDPKIDELIALLNESKDPRHYLNITEAFPISTR